MLFLKHGIGCRIESLADNECVIKITDWQMDIANIQEALDSVD